MDAVVRSDPAWSFQLLLWLQEVEEEEPAERYSDEEAPAATGEPEPAAANSPAKEEQVEVKEEDGQSKDESKCEDKGDLAGERQSGDGQVGLDGDAGLLWCQGRLEDLLPPCGQR